MMTEWEICQAFDRNCLTVADLAMMSGRTVAEIKSILMGGVSE